MSVCVSVHTCVGVYVCGWGQGQGLGDLRQILATLG